MGSASDTVYQVAIIGAGVSGATAAIRLSEIGVSTLLIEKKESVVNGPPFCHLHAGGNLYPDISDEQCIALLEQSIDMAKLYPQSIDKRPTFISIPKTEIYEPKDLIQRLEILVDTYKNLIAKDATNKILGEPEAYYKVYEKKDLDTLKAKNVVGNPQNLDDWMIAVAQAVDYNQLKFPVIMVEEYGWNLFRLAAQAQIALESLLSCHLMLNTEVLHVTDYSNQDEAYNWKIETTQGVYYAQYLLNAAGYQTGEFDNDIHIQENRLVEFKAAYVSHWTPPTNKLPELVFHGKRGTPNGMAQLTPYADGYFQIHGMTEQITLFEDGLVKSKRADAQPDLNDAFDIKLEEGWPIEEIEKRTQRAIAFIAQYVPTFGNATVGGPPLYGAQQIPGEDANLRVAEISFPKKYYGRSEIVKASSALDVADQLVKRLKKLQLISDDMHTDRKFDVLNAITPEAIEELAQSLATERGYAASMGTLYESSI